MAIVIPMLIGVLLSHVSAADEPSANRPPIRIVMIGDSTMASYPNPPADRPDLTGWGQVFHEFFEPEVTILNRALSGRSSKSFLAEGAWKKALAEKPDYVFIQFGHNDQPGKGDRATDPNGDFRDNLRRYIRETREARATPILVTPVARRTFQDGKAVTTLTPYAEATLAVASEEKTVVIDLHRASLALYEELGDAASADFSPSVSDRTHFSRKGARAMAKLVAEELAKQTSPLTKHLTK
ncbi:MAG: rhamnogalacturonan acetylesterase [Planctomycetales bacterium]|nr:rhamnogalacturonan acetylesterase [Planctomycetales bacterium]